MSQKKHKNERFEGRFSLGKNGIAYITNKETGQVIEVHKHHAGTALSRDFVLVEITDPRRGIGEVVEVIQRAKKGFVGVVHRKGENYVLIPDDFKIPEIFIPREHADEENLVVGEKAYVEIEQYEPLLIGKIKKHLGAVGSNDALMHGIALEQGFDFSFPKEVEEEANVIDARGITKEERTKRRDMRDVTTFTIDPEDAKDFDDALSFREIDEHTYEVGIHIADVSHYVQPGSAIDKEAQKRTTSVYLVDRTIPMLPEVLSNGLCSLNEGEEKLAFSTIFHIDKETGAIKKEWFGKTLIQSNKRFTYEEAQDVIDGKQSGPFQMELRELNRLAKIYQRQRYARGSLDFETYEVKFILDERGKPISVKVKERIDTNKLIEEFMLLSNNRVARFMKDAPFFVYRIHERPERRKMEYLQEFLKLLGYEVKLQNGIIPMKVLQKIVREAEGSPIYDTLQTAIVRSMQKAMYSTKNVGHYGLAFRYYTHFTSPIRRYPDIMVHRLLEERLKHKRDPFGQEWYEKLCVHSSNMELAAVTAERNSVKQKQVEYMAQRNPDEVFIGIVTGASKFGLFVAEEESRSEGMIRLGDLGDDFFEYHEKDGTIRGKRTKMLFKLGDKVRIRIKNVDLQKQLIDYLLVEKIEEK